MFDMFIERIMQVCQVNVPGSKKRRVNANYSEVHVNTKALLAHMRAQRSCIDDLLVRYLSRVLLICTLRSCSSMRFAREGCVTLGKHWQISSKEGACQSESFLE